MLYLLMVRKKAPIVVHLLEAEKKATSMLYLPPAQNDATNMVVLATQENHASKVRPARRVQKDAMARRRVLSTAERYAFKELLLPRRNRMR